MLLRAWANFSDCGFSRRVFLFRQESPFPSLIGFLPSFCQALAEDRVTTPTKKKKKKGLTTGNGWLVWFFWPGASVTLQCYTLKAQCQAKLANLMVLIDPFFPFVMKEFYGIRYQSGSSSSSRTFLLKVKAFFCKPKWLLFLY